MLSPPNCPKADLIFVSGDQTGFGINHLYPGAPVATPDLRPKQHHAGR